MVRVSFLLAVVFAPLAGAQVGLQFPLCYGCTYPAKNHTMVLQLPNGDPLLVSAAQIHSDSSLFSGPNEHLQISPSPPSQEGYGPLLTLEIQALLSNAVEVYIH
jgi:hypothetical protein